MIYNSYDNVGLIKVLSFLKSHNTEYLSGQDLSQVLKISRVAVWKHIKKIQALGYKIESKQKLGYKLVKNTNLLLPWEISDNIKTRKIGKRSYYFDTVDSTQNYALSIASSKKEDGAIIIAQKQTKGKGRQGRKWISPKGGIWLSIILHPTFDVSISTLFPLAAAVALSKTIKKIFNVDAKVKWPNDILIKDKKVAGMIVDATIESNKIENLVLGIGVNFNVNSKSIEKAITKTQNYSGVISLNNANPKNFVQEFLVELEKYYLLLEDGKTKKIIRDWSRHSSTIGKNVTAETSEGQIRGKALRIDSDGALILKTGKKIHKIVSGDLKHLTK